MVCLGQTSSRHAEEARLEATGDIEGMKLEVRRQADGRSFVTAATIAKRGGLEHKSWQRESEGGQTMVRGVIRVDVWSAPPGQMN